MAANKSRIALITGGNRGLGKSMALHLADAGVDVVLTYKSGADSAKEVVAAIEKKGRKATALQLDVGDSKSYPAFVEKLQAALASRFDRKTIDALVNNAGTGSDASIANISEDEFDDLVRVHLKSVVFLTQRLLPILEDGGRILNVSSGLARFSMPGRAAYAAMKGGVEVLTRYMAQELGPRGIKVNTIAPGAIATDFGGGHVRDNPQVNAHVASLTALGRVGLPDDIGAAVSLLLSPDARWITGQRIEVSGGMLL
ncbi:MAG TPA: SDR family oxidoreductase [Myxococcota bacterium]|jgi:NAD(P)-dependent dehydrogenase (short-subunit alcohol dehydrogenase family)